jgi:phage minor structural protein
MLIITDIFGNTEALTDIQNVEVIEEVNGDFSLSFTVFLSEKNQHSYPLVQEESIVELDGLEFRIKKMIEVKNRKQITAKHIFFETIDNQIYTINGGTINLDSAAAFALAGSGWTFENVDISVPKLIPNFGEDNTVSLVNQICAEFLCERKIQPGRILRFEKEVGEDNDQQFRYKHNIKTLKRTVDTTNFATVIKGYGADGLVVEYRSPNISLYGERHAEPIRDERFTNPENLLEKCKQSIQDVPEVSIEVELTQLGFDAQLGDKVWLIYEPLNLEFQTRIMSMKSWPFLNRSPVVELSNRKQTFTDLLTQTKIEVKENKKETRSKFVQTDEKFNLEVNRLDESIGTLQIEADNIVLNVQSIDSRLGTAEGQIGVQAGQIALKVSQTDYNANTIASLINMSPTAIDIESQKLNLKGYITATSLATPGATIIDGGNIQTGNFSADRILGGVLRLLAGFAGNTANIYAEEATYGTGNLIFSAGRYTFEQGGTIDFQNNAVTGLNVTVSFG